MDSYNDPRDIYYDDNVEGMGRTGAPWFHDVNEAEAQKFYDGQLRTLNDLERAQRFLADVENKILYPIDSPIEIAHYILPEYVNDAEQHFTVLARRIIAEGGNVIHRPDTDRNAMQHVATLPLGSGRVLYRVVWIEKDVNE